MWYTEGEGKACRACVPVGRHLRFGTVFELTLVFSKGYMAGIFLCFVGLRCLLNHVTIVLALLLLLR
jgi:hypothetical protein